MTLCEAYCGEALRIVKMPVLDAHGLRLRELGFCETAIVRKVSDGTALLCQICGVRLAIGRELASGILVERVRA